MLAVALARSWHATWWEWHLLVLLAFVIVARSAWQEWKVEGSPAEIWSDIYQERTRGHSEELTVLFADLQGFTSYSEQTSEEEVKAMLDEYWRAAAPVAEAHDGWIDKTIGDALMIVFSQRRPRAAGGARGARLPAATARSPPKSAGVAALSDRRKLGLGRSSGFPKCAAPGA